MVPPGAWLIYLIAYLKIFDFTKHRKIIKSTCKVFKKWDDFAADTMISLPDFHGGRTIRDWIKCFVKWCAKDLWLTCEANWLVVDPTFCSSTTHLSAFFRRLANSSPPSDNMRITINMHENRLFGQKTHPIRAEAISDLIKKLNKYHTKMPRSFKIAP